MVIYRHKNWEIYILIAELFAVMAVPHLPIIDLKPGAMRHDAGV